MPVCGLEDTCPDTCALPTSAETTSSCPFSRLPWYPHEDYHVEGKLVMNVAPQVCLQRVHLMNFVRYAPKPCNTM